MPNTPATYELLVLNIANCRTGTQDRLKPRAIRCGSLEEAERIRADIRQEHGPGEVVTGIRNRARPAPVVNETLPGAQLWPPQVRRLTP